MIPGQGTNRPCTAGQLSLRVTVRILSLHASAKEAHVPQCKIPHVAMRITSATTKTDAAKEIRLKKKKKERKTLLNRAVSEL